MKRPSLDTRLARKTSALVPLLCLSGAWTASMLVPNAGATPTTAPSVSLPAQPVQARASWSRPTAPAVAEAARWARGRTAPDLSSNAIPATALAAYQRAAQIMDEADPGCHLPWTVLAAIGRVESDHGRSGGNLLTADGVATPGIFGVPLTGSRGTRRITDTDAGVYDEDRRFDRAVGPMQFIPSTWSVVGVDGDGDKKRNPQDVDDAALAAAVYLCSGTEDVSTRAGFDRAVFRYNHSREYVDLVHRIALAYATGDYRATVVSTYAPTYLAPVSTLAPERHPQHPTGEATQASEVADARPSSDPKPEPTDAVARDPKPATKPVASAQAAVVGTVSAVAEATESCAATLTQVQLNLLVGLQSCLGTLASGLAPTKP